MDSGCSSVVKQTSHHLKGEGSDPATTVGACTLKLFTAVIVAVLQKASVFAFSTHFHPSLIFLGKAGSLPLVWNLIKDSTVGPNLLQTLD